MAEVNASFLIGGGLRPLSNLNLENKKGALDPLKSCPILTTFIYGTPTGRGISKDIWR